MVRKKKEKETIEPIDQMTLVVNEIEQIGSKVLSNLDDLASNSYLSSEIWGLDYAVSHGGIPSTYVVEVHGPNTVGKTCLALHYSKRAKVAGMNVFYVNMEYAVNDSVARIYLDKNDVRWIHPDSGEAALDIIKYILKTTTNSFIALDSVGACIPSKIAEGDVGDSHMSVQARMFAQFGNPAAAWCKKNNNILFCLNQESTTMRGGVYLPGGKRWSYVPDLRIRLTKRYKPDPEIKEGDQIIGHVIQAEVTKNRHGPPYRVVDLPLIYEYGFDVHRELLENAVNFGVILKGGSWLSYTWQGEEINKQGGSAMALWLSHNADAEEKIRIDLLEIVS